MIPVPGEVFCRRCRSRGERTDEREFYCDHPAFKDTDFLGDDHKPLCSYVNASKNCNGFEEKS
jgi:hypothetical protein